MMDQIVYKWISKRWQVSVTSRHWMFSVRFHNFLQVWLVLCCPLADTELLHIQHIKKHQRLSLINFLIRWKCTSWIPIVSSYLRILFHFNVCIFTIVYYFSLYLNISTVLLTFLAHQKSVLKSGVLWAVGLHRTTIKTEQIDATVVNRAVMTTQTSYLLLFDCFVGCSSTHLIEIIK